MDRRVFTGTDGLNTDIDPARLKYDSKTGVQDLAACLNVEVSNSRRVSRRKGYTERISGNCHSAFCDGADAMVVKDDALCVLHSDYTTTPIRNVTPGARVSYVQVDNVIYYSNGYEQGKLKTGGDFDGLSYTWSVSEYVGPETTKEFSGPPIGTLLEFFAGRMWIVQGKIIWYSEPHGVSLYNLADSSIAFEDEVIMLRATVDGLWVSTDKAVTFVDGTDPDEMAPRTVTDYPAIKGTDFKYYGRASRMQNGRVSINEKGGILCALWLSEEGICYGGPEGTFYNLTEDRADLPNALTGAGLVYDGKYIGNMNP